MNKPLTLRTEPHPFRYPRSMEPHIKRIMEGEYDVAYEHPAPVILDIGANVGAFAFWALQRWPGSSVHCYEPHPDTFATLVQNVSSTQRVACHNVAVTNEAGSRILYDGKHNCGEASLIDIGEQIKDRHHLVPVIDAFTLPHAHIVKIDTEGSEGVILSRLLAEMEPEAVLFEYHSDYLRRKCDTLLREYILVGASGVCNYSAGQRGTLKYLHQRLFDGKSNT